MDVSGSMEGNRLAVAKNAVNQVADRLLGYNSTDPANLNSMMS